MRQCLAPSEKAMECFPSNPGCFVQVHSDPAHRGDGVWPGSLGWGGGGPAFLALEAAAASQCYQPPDQAWPGHPRPPAPTEATVRLFMDYPPIESMLSEMGAGLGS